MKFERYRELLGHFVFELVIVFVGVTAAFALEGMRQRSEETAYRRSMISALVPTLDDVISHNRDFADHVGHELAAFDSALARGAHPPIPIYRENDSERPPTRAWDAVVTTGVARSLDPGLFFRLARFYTREDSYGERYLRYNDFTEQHVFTLGDPGTEEYDRLTGRLKPQFAAHVDRLRDLVTINQNLRTEAIQLRDQLIRLN